MTDPERLAEVAVVVGANVQPGQVVQVTADVAQLALVQAIADAAYRHGARFVDAQLTVPALRRSLILHGPAKAYVPAWADAPAYGLDAAHGARIMVAGPSLPGLLDDLDPALVDRAQPPRSRAWREVEYRVNNTIVPGPHAGWARARHPSLDGEAALAALWRDVATATRLDATDPVAQWRRRFAALGERATELDAAGLDVIRLRGPGTDLAVGLLAGARWAGPTHVNERGVRHGWNIPSEEVYTSPDPARVDGYVTLTRPAVVGGTLVPDVVLHFRGGALQQIDGGAGVERLRAFVDRDAGTRRVGELALVDGDSAVAAVSEPFGLVLLDENVASHLALGFGFPELADDPQTRGRVNVGDDHLDLTIGSPHVQVTGIGSDGAERPLIRDGRWAMPAGA